MSVEITKESLINILKDLGKEYRKRVGKQMPAEMIPTLISYTSTVIIIGHLRTF